MVAKTSRFNFVLIAFLLIVILLTLSSCTNMKNGYMERYMGYDLINPKQLAVIQGVPATNTMTKPLVFDEHAELPAVDGTNNGPKSMFVFTYNKVSPQCCDGSSGGYSSSGGCVCLTEKQKQYFASRGVNTTPSKCSSSEY